MSGGMKEIRIGIWEHEPTLPLTTPKRLTDERIQDIVLSGRCDLYRAMPDCGGEL